MIESLVYGLLYVGIFGLMSTVAYSFLLCDVPVLMVLPGSEINARQHYSARGRHYRIAVPVYCVCLTTGVVGNLLQHRNLAALFAFMVAFGTAVNNGKNVVNPSKQLAKKGTYHLLRRIAHGHIIDMVGFILIFVISFSF